MRDLGGAPGASARGPGRVVRCASVGSGLITKERAVLPPAYAHRPRHPRPGARATPERHRVVVGHRPGILRGTLTLGNLKSHRRYLNGEK
jgi:hypothetical protein